MFRVEFPYDIGTFVKIKSNFRETNNEDIGTIACYNCVDDEPDSNGDQFVVVVSGYKDAWCGEYLVREIELLTEEEIEKVKNKYNK